MLEMDNVLNQHGLPLFTLPMQILDVHIATKLLGHNHCVVAKVADTCQELKF